jgi:hypothetical protein
VRGNLVACGLETAQVELLGLGLDLLEGQGVHVVTLQEGENPVGPGP